MQKATPTTNEQQRLDALYRLGVLDTPSEERFDRITRLAQRFFNVPIALVSLVDRDRQWFKSRQGLDACETGRDISFCGHAIKSEELMVVENAAEDERFHDNPLVTGEPYLQFYAGCPLRAPGGELIGTLCLIDTRPRRLSSKELASLRDLGAQVEEELGAHFAKSGFFVLDRFPTLVSSPVASALIAILMFTAMVWGVIQYDRQYLETLRAEDEKDVISQLSLVRGNLESALNAKLALVNGPSGMVHANSSVDQKTFARFAQQIGKNVEGVMGLQLAPEGVVTYVWPLESNRAAIGHDILADERRVEAARQAISSRSSWIAGPLNLIQGGTALIVRHPIFLPDSSTGQEYFWGFSAMLLDLQVLYAEAGLTDVGNTAQFAIRGKDGKGSQGDMFYGPKDFEWDNALKAQVTLPSGSWEIGAIPIGGWSAHYDKRQRPFVGLGFAALLLAGLLYFLLRMPHNLRKMIRTSTAALQRSETRFRDAMESAPSGFVVFDQNGQLALNNQYFTALYHQASGVIGPGMPYRTFVESTLEAGVYRLDLHQEEGIKQQLLNLLNEREASLELQLSGGRWVNILYHRMRDGGWVGFHRDITELRENQTQLVVEKTRAEEANKTKSDFLATVSHEVRTPLNGVLGMLGMLRESKQLSAEESEYVHTAYQSAEHLLSILNEILDISKIEAGKLVLEPEIFNVAELLSATSELLSVSIKEKGLDFSLRCEEALSEVMVSADHGRLRQVLLNLLANAVKFTHSGSVGLAARTLAKDDSSISIEIKVEDTGIGFSSTDIDKLFEPFTQLHTDADRQFGGSGIGLAICRRIIEAMGGTLTAYGEPGKGACFTVALSLPLAQMPVAASEEIPMGAPPLPKDMGLTIRLLMAEDGETNRIVIQAMLKDSGYQIDVAHDGQEAVDAVARFPYDVILMDVYMPNMDGIEATRQIRSSARGEDIPIIALTANAMDGDREKFIEAGMNDYLPKPVKKTDLLSTLARHVLADRTK